MAGGFATRSPVGTSHRLRRGYRRVATGRPPIDIDNPTTRSRPSGLRRLRGVRHVGVALAAVIIITTALPIPPIQAVGERFETVARVTHLTQSWRVFAPNVRSAARWTEVVAQRDTGVVDRWYVEDDRNLVAGFRGIRYRKFAEQLRRSCRVARNYAEVLLDERGVVQVDLYRIIERYEDDAPGPVQERERMMHAAYDDAGEVRIDRTGCGE
jgi:hypothetical protein